MKQPSPPHTHFCYTLVGKNRVYGEKKNETYRSHKPSTITMFMICWAEILRLK